MEKLLNLLLPSACLGCARWHGALCDRCLQSVRLGLRLRPIPRRHVGAPLYAVGSHSGLLRAAVVEYKDAGRRELSRPLGIVLGELLARLAPPGWQLCPVPTTPTAVRRRGFDHIALLAAGASRVTGMPWQRLLRRTGQTVDSVGLDAAERWRHAASAFEAMASTTRPVVIVDDVVTTGATLSHAVAALRRADAHVAAAVVVTATS